MSSNGHIPRHNQIRAEELAHHTPWWRRARTYLASRPRAWWIFRVAVALTVVNLAMLLYNVLDDGEDHSQHSHDTKPAAVREVTNKHCVQALARADEAFTAAAKFGESMASFHAEALALAKYLEPGDEGRSVRALQQRLRDAGVDVEVDGDYGEDTRQAVAEFRRQNGRHVADSKAFLGDLADIRQRYEAAKLGCQLQPPTPTTGGRS